MKKTFISILLASLICLCTVNADEIVGHGDLAAPSGWALEEIGDAESIGMLYGFKQPWTNAITREQFCILSYNMLEFAVLPEWETNAEFTDTQNEKVTGLYHYGVINGRGDGIFDPNGTITREEAATILYNISENFGMETDSIISTLEAYADDENISDWARKNVYNMRKIGIMVGKDEGFMPKDSITVEESIVTILRLYKLWEGDKALEEEFGDKLLRLIPDDKNSMISPLSVKLALMMAANGADGETKQEICDVLGVSDLDAYNEEIKKLIATYSQSELLKLDVSNSIWINEDKTPQRFSAEFTQRAKDVFDASADVVNDETATDKINTWVNDKTKGKIPEIIEEGNSDFWAMLINAVYFKGRWQNEFHPEATKPDTFTSRNGVETQIDFMNRTAWMSYGNEEGVEIIEIPYLIREDLIDDEGNYVETKILDGVDVSMYLVMSDRNISPVKAVNSTETSSEFVALSVPKFTVEYSDEISPYLKALGINKAFSPEDAEFSGMFTEGNMWLTNVIHKTYIKVDEEGTEAAAITASAMAGSARPPEPIPVKFNKPFYFVIMDNANGEALFVGEYAFGE